MIIKKSKSLLSNIVAIIYNVTEMTFGIFILSWRSMPIRDRFITERERTSPKCAALSRNVRVGLKGTFLQ